MPAALLLLLAAPDAGVLLARPVQISAQHLVVDNKAQTATYSGTATVVRDGTTLTCDSLTVTYAPGRAVKRITAAGNVTARDGDRVAAGQAAEYDNDTGVLVVTGEPRVTQGHREVTGERITLTTGTDVVEVTKPRTRVEDPAGKGGPATVTVDADTLVLEQQRTTATWSGAVKVQRGPTTLTAPELTAHYADDGALTRVDAKGGVEATEGDRWARGRKATFDVKRGVLVVTGNPQARQGTTRLAGSKVTFVSGKDVIEVENATTVMQVDPKKGALK